MQTILQISFSDSALVGCLIDNFLYLHSSFAVSDDNIQYEGFALPKCKSAQGDDEVPCEGGVIAINGATGSLLWQTWSVANVFSLLCTLDVDLDGYPDCVAAGRLGVSVVSA